jgi:hypothetical protein
MLVLMLSAFIGGIDKLVEAAGKGILSFAALAILLIVYSADRWFFRKKTSGIRTPGETGFGFIVWLIYIACVIFLILVLKNPSDKKPEVKADKTIERAQPIEKPTSTPEVKGPPALRQCVDHTEKSFTPHDAGIIQPGNLGDAGDGQVWTPLRFTWQAPAKVVSVLCKPGRSTYLVRQQATAEDPTVAECYMKTDGGNDVITVDIAWDGPCTKQ